MTIDAQLDTLPRTEIEIADELNEADLDDLCDATRDVLNDTASGFSIGFTRVGAPMREQLQTYWRGVLIVPERQLIVGRVDRTVAASIQLVKPSSSNKTSAFAASVESHFVAPWARGHGLARELLRVTEDKARQLGFSVLKLSVRATQEAAIHLYEKAGYTRWGTLEKYEIVEGVMVAGHFYYKDL